MNDESRMRTSIYSYLEGYRVVFSLIWIGLTLIGMTIKVLIELNINDIDSATQTYEAILAGMPVVWISSIGTALIITEVYAMLKDIVGLDRKVEKARAEGEAKGKAEGRAEAQTVAQAEIARLKNRIAELERDR